MKIMKKKVCQFIHPASPKIGDVALVQVTQIGANQFIEHSSGANLQIFPGSLIVGAFANRYAPDGFEGVIPEVLELDNVDLLNRGGVFGQVVSKNSAIPNPTKCKLLAFLGDEDGQGLNTLSHVSTEDTDRELNPTEIKLGNRKLIVVTGTSMNAGKSNTAKAIIYALTSAGESVVAGKVTGTAARKDALLMQTAGATDVCDFLDFGYPSTYLLSEKEILSLFWRMIEHLKARSERDSYIVIEIADGLFQREAEMILSNKEIKDYVNHFVFSCPDALSAITGYRWMQDNFDIRLTAISGPSANSSLGLKEIQRHLIDVPIFNNMVLDVPTIASIFQAQNPISEKAVKRAAMEMEVMPETIVPANFPIK